MSRSKLQRELRQSRPFRSREEEAFLNLQRSAGQLQQAFTQTLRPFGLTPTQYNALRILRGAHPQALACGEVGERMVTPMPDVTRLLDRLEAQGWVRRARDLEDRRVVTAAITDAGLELLASLDAPVEAWLRASLGHLGEEALGTLVTLLERARERAE